MSPSFGVIWSSDSETVITNSESYVKFSRMDSCLKKMFCVTFVYFVDDHHLVTIRPEVCCYLELVLVFFSQDELVEHDLLLNLLISRFRVNILLQSAVHPDQVGHLRHCCVVLEDEPLPRTQKVLVVGVKRVVFDPAHSRAIRG